MKNIHSQIPLLLVLLIAIQFIAAETKIVSDLQFAEADLGANIVSGYVPKVAPSRSEVNTWPKNLSEAVNDLLASMSESFKNEVRSKKEKDLVQYHLSWGMGIRNAYGLWRGNDDLIKSVCGESCHPDTASMIIIEAVWTALQEQT